MTTQKRPNILWICTDQQRWNTLGCYGNENANTPNLDRLAENGTIFDTAFCQSPVSTPSRVSFLTGRYPRTARGRQNGQNIPEEEVLVTRLLHDAGYYGGLSGELLGDHGLYLKGGYFYDEAIRVPLIMSYLGVIKSQRSSALIEVMDIAQTILDACGVPHHEGMQGKSFWNLLTTGANKDEHRDDVYCEFYNALADAKTTTPFLTMLRNKEYKLTVDHPRNTGELYDLINDKHETTDLWDRAEFANIKTEMLLSLCNRMAFTADPLPRRLAAH